MKIEQFVGREAQVRTIMSNINAQHSTLVIGEAGIGKTALLEVISPLLESEGNLVSVSTVRPFGTFLRETFIGLWDKGLIPEQSKDIQQDLKIWGKKQPSNDTKAAHLINLIKTLNIILVIDDVEGVTPTSRPWLEKLVDNCTVIAATDPKALKRSGSKRFWKRFDELVLEQLSHKESEQLLETLINRYRVNADEPEIYTRRVLALAQGNPFELERLVKYHSSETLVKTKDLGGYSQSFVERDEKGIALAPLMLVFAALGIASRYIARAQGDLDLYVIGGISIGVFIVIGPFLRSTLKPRSN